MPVKKILLKNNRGAFLASLTVKTGEGAEIKCPPALLPLACLADERVLFPSAGRITLPRDATEISLLGRWGEEIAFASTLPSSRAAEALGWLLARAEEKSWEGKVPTSPLQEPPKQPAEEALSKAPEEEAQAAPEEASRQEEAEETLVERARRLIETREPFTLFQSLMPNSIWAKIENEEIPCVIGILQDDAGERVLYGVAGSRSYPPDEDRLWTFFPTDEKGEEGYYLTEGE